MKLLDEKNLEQEITQVVEPFLEQYRTIGRLDDKIYYELYKLPGAKATIVFSHGASETCVKFHEFIYYAMQEGYSCAIMDHLGHGHSMREGRDLGVVHVSKFDRYGEFFHEFVHSVVIPSLGGTLYLFGHSMGGCIAADYLEKWPGEFKKAVLSSPMLGIDTGSIPTWAGMLLCNVQCFLRRGDKKLFFQGDFSEKQEFASSCSTSEARYNWYHAIRCKDPALQHAPSSYSWTREAVKAGKRVVSQASKIQIPVLLFQAETDGLVLPEPQERFISQIKDGKLIHVAHSKHEIYRSENYVLKDYFAQIFAFYGDEKKD